jgi:hypothetical protein
VSVEPIDAVVGQRPVQARFEVDVGEVGIATVDAPMVADLSRVVGSLSQPGDEFVHVVSASGDGDLTVTVDQPFGGGSIV